MPNAGVEEGTAPRRAVAAEGAACGDYRDNRCTVVDVGVVVAAAAAWAGEVERWVRRVGVPIRSSRSWAEPGSDCIRTLGVAGLALEEAATSDRTSNPAVAGWLVVGEGLELWLSPKRPCQTLLFLVAGKKGRA